MMILVLNLGVGRHQLFGKPDDFAAFEEIVAETLDKCVRRICDYCLMPNHCHFTLWPEHDGFTGQRNSGDY